MRNITVYPHKAFRSGNEAVVVTATDPLAEVLDRGSVLGWTLFTTAAKLGIQAYPFKPECDAVVFEGNLPEIDKRREKLVGEQALKIAKRALKEPYWKYSTMPDKDILAPLIRNFAAPYGGLEEDPFYNRLVRSLGYFAGIIIPTAQNSSELISERKCSYNPLDPELETLIREAKASPEYDPGPLSGILEGLLKELSLVGRLDGLPPAAEVAIALRDYLRRRATETYPGLLLRVHLATRREEREARKQQK